MKPIKPSARRLAAVAKRNALFTSATKPEQRVMIAKDVLARLAAKQYRPKSSVWVGVPKSRVENGQSLQHYVADKGSCQVCALGGVMASYAFFANDIKIEADHHDGAGVSFKDVCDLLTGVFGMDAMREIEHVFERGAGNLDLPFGTSYERRNLLSAFSLRHRSNRALFKAIFTNIVVVESRAQIKRMLK